MDRTGAAGARALDVAQHAGGGSRPWQNVGRRKPLECVATICVERAGEKARLYSRRVGPALRLPPGGAGQTCDRGVIGAMQSILQREHRLAVQRAHRAAVLVNGAYFFEAVRSACLGSWPRISASACASGAARRRPSSTCWNDGTGRPSRWATSPTGSAVRCDAVLSTHYPGYSDTAYSPNVFRSFSSIAYVTPAFAWIDRTDHAARHVFHHLPVIA